MDIVQHVVDYIRSSKAELMKVTWPSKQDTIRYSTLVIGASVALALFFAVLDKGLISAVETIITRRPVTTPTQQTQPQPTAAELNQAIDIETASGTNGGQIKVDTLPLDSETKK